MTSQTSLTGAAGEHFVMSELLRRDLIAALAPAGVLNCDIVVTDDIGDRLWAIQVKTRRGKGADGGWHMSRKHEILTSPTLFYCFVDFAIGTPSPPFTCVVPARVVAVTLAKAHVAWLGQPGAKGQRRNDSDFRRFLPDYGHLGMADRAQGWLEPYREAWDQLKLSASGSGRALTVGGPRVCTAVLCSRRRSHHLRRMEDDLAQLGLVDDGEIVLDEAALTLALLDHPDVDPGPYEDLLSSISDRLAEVGAGVTASSDRAGLLSQVLAGEFGFAGDRETYDDPDNADLIRVVDRLRGLPISLSILYIAAARRVGWVAEVLNLPGHVLVMGGHDAAPVVIDPFRGGVRLDLQGVAALLSSAAGGVAAPARHLSALPNRSILVRLLLNQATRAETAGLGRRALTLYRRMTSIAPDHPHPWWERARLELVDGDVPAARISLAAMLEVTREPELRARGVRTLDALAAR